MKPDLGQLLDRGDGNVIGINRILAPIRYASLRERILEFYLAAEQHALNSLTVDPKVCIDATRNYIYARQTAERFNLAFTSNSATISEEFRLETQSGVNRFILTPNDTSPTPDITYAVFVPKPDPKDPRIVRILRTLGIDKDSQYCLLTIGPWKGALVDEPTKPAMEMILQQCDLNQTELLKAHVAEVTYILLDDGRIAKFVTLPKAVLKIRALDSVEGDPFSEYSPNADALSVIHNDSVLITNVLTAFRRAALWNTQTHNVK